MATAVRKTVAANTVVDTANNTTSSLSLRCYRLEPDPRGAPPFDFHRCEKQVENWDDGEDGGDGLDDGGDEHLSQHQSHQRGRKCWRELSRAAVFIIPHCRAAFPASPKTLLPNSNSNTSMK